MSDPADPAVVGRMVRFAAAVQAARARAGTPPLGDAELGARLRPPVSASWVVDHVPRGDRAVGIAMVEDKTKTKEEPKAPAKAPPGKAPAQAKRAPAAAEKKPAEKRAPKTAEERQSYTAGVSCGRGKHKWVDKGTYFKCKGGENPLCRSTKTKHPAKPAAEKKEKPGATHPPSFGVEIDALASDDAGARGFLGLPVKAEGAGPVSVGPGETVTIIGQGEGGDLRWSKGVDLVTSLREGRACAACGADLRDSPLVCPACGAGQPGGAGPARAPPGGQPGTGPVLAPVAPEMPAEVL